MYKRKNKFTSVPEVRNDLQSVTEAVRALKQSVEVLTRQSGTESDWAVTVADLESYVTRALSNQSPADALNDTLLDAILDRAAAAADREAQKVRDEAYIGLAKLQTALENFKNGYEDNNAIVRGQITQLEAAVGSNEAKIISEQLTRTTTTQALAGRIDTVNAQFQGNIAAVTTDILAISDANSSLATRIDNVTTASTGARTYVQSTAPVSLSTNAYWVDLSTGTPVVKQWSGSVWNTLSATIAATAPTSPTTGTLWFDTNESLLKRWSGSAWVTQAAFVQSRTPSTILVGDIWVDTSLANTIKRWNGTSWVNLTKDDNLLGILLSSLTTESISKTDGDRTTGARINNLISVAPDGNSATINSTQLTTATRTSALADDLTALEVQTTGGSAGGFYRLLASSSPGDGAAAEFQVQVRAAESGSGSTYATAGMRIQAFADGTSRVKFNTDQFIVTNATGTFVPFAITTSGQLAINAAVEAAKLLGGLGTNVMYNTTFEAGTEGWSVGTNQTGLTATVGRDLNAANKLDGGHTLYITLAGTPAANLFIDVNNASSATPTAQYPVIAGKRYEASAYIAPLRAQYSYVQIAWYDVNDTFLSSTDGNQITTASTGGTTLAGYGRSYAIGAAPAGAVTCQVRVRTRTSALANPYCFVTRPYFGEAGAGQTDPSVWTAGIEPQFGSAFQINASNISTYIAGAAIGTAYIENAAITSAKIGAAEVGTLKIAGNAVTLAQVFSSTTNVNNIGGTEVDAISGSITVSGTQPILVQFNGFCGGASSDGGTPSAFDANVRAIAYIGTNQKTIVPDLTVKSNNLSNSSGAVLFTGIAAGTYTARVGFQCTNGTVVFLKTPTLIILETKR